MPPLHGNTYQLTLLDLKLAKQEIATYSQLLMSTLGILCLSCSQLIDTNSNSMLAISVLSFRSPLGYTQWQR